MLRQFGNAVKRCQVSPMKSSPWARQGKKKTSRNMQQSPSFTSFHKFWSKLFTLVFTDLCLCLLYRFIMLSSSCFIMVLWFLCQTSSSCGSSLASLSNASMAVRSLRKTHGKPGGNMIYTYLHTITHVGFFHIYVYVSLPSGIYRTGKWRGCTKCCDDVWWCLMIFDDVWWCLMMFDDVWHVDV